MRWRGLQCHHQQMQFCHWPHPWTLFSQAAGGRRKRYAHFSCLFSSMQQGEVSLSLLCFLFMVRRVLALLVVFSVCSQWRGGAKPSLLCFLFVFNGEEGFGPPHCVCRLFSKARRGKTLLIVVSVGFQWQGGPKPSSPHFLFVYDGEEGYTLLA